MHVIPERENWIFMVPFSSQLILSVSLEKCSAPKWRYYGWRSKFKYKVVIPLSSVKDVSPNKMSEKKIGLTIKTNTNQEVTATYGDLTLQGIFHLQTRRWGPWKTTIGPRIPWILRCSFTGTCRELVISAGKPPFHDTRGLGFSLKERTVRQL